MLNVKIANPTGVILDTKVPVVIAKLINGERSFYPNHIPFLSIFDHGYIIIDKAKINIDHGTFLLDKDNNVEILISDQNLDQPKK